MKLIIWDAVNFYNCIYGKLVNANHSMAKWEFDLKNAHFKCREFSFEVNVLEFCD